MTAFAELAVTTNFSFLRGASHPEELVAAAAALGLAGIAVADRNTLAGVVRGHIAAKEVGLRYAVGARLAFRDGSPDVLAWPTDRAAYGRLCRLLSLGNLRAEKGECHLDLGDLLIWGKGMILGVVPGIAASGDQERLADTLRRLSDAFPGAVRLMASFPHGPGDRRRLALLARTGRHFGTRLLATNDVLYHRPERRRLQDVLTAIREHKTLATAGKLLAVNAERHLKDAAEMARLFRGLPEAVAESKAVLEHLTFSLDELRYQYPDEPTGDAASPQEALERLTEKGARWRYPEGVPEHVRKNIAHELRLIAELNYAPYFLTVHDIVRFAREKEILCQGRGSAANSAVCFCLGITEVNPETTDLLFERFISPERKEPPDIDVDFEHERREEVMQYIYGKYSRDRAGIAATVITYRTRSAIREVGKVFGLSDDTIGALSGSVWGISNEGVSEAAATRVGLDPATRITSQVLELAREIVGFPRHLSQHVGGFVITRDRLDESVPIMNARMEERTNIEWDKDDLDAVGMLKVDVLALGMLSCIRRAFEFMARHYGAAPTLATIPGEDPAVYRMLQRADSLGVFQVESRAQMTMLPRLRPEKFYDLVIEVAIVRPGPIQGDMVHPYLRRRQGIETVHYPSPSPEHGPADELERVLDRTLGVPLFQEQAMKIAMVAAKFTAAEADKLRRAMATFKRVGTIGTFQMKMIEGMVARGYQRDFAERCFHQIEGFGEYGFPESHAASFALLVYASAWLKCHYPDVFCAALLNAQPMGFYAPAQIVRDAERHGIAVHAVDVNSSNWDCTLEENDTVEEEALSSPIGRGLRLLASAASLEAKGEGLGPIRGGHIPSSLPMGEEAGSLPASEYLEADPTHHASHGPPSPFRGGITAISGSVVQQANRPRSAGEKQPESRTSPALIRQSTHREHPSPARGGGTARSAVGGVPPCPAHGDNEDSIPSSERGGSGRGQSPRSVMAPLPTSPLQGEEREPLDPTGKINRRLHSTHAGMADDIRSTHAVRLGFRQIKGFSEDDARKLMAARGRGYDSVRDLWLRSGLTRAAIERLADADAFRSLGLDRREALWAARGLGGGKERDRLPLFDTPEFADIRREPDVGLPPMLLGEHVVNDYRFLSLSLKAHPVSFIRRTLAGQGIIASEALRDPPRGAEDRRSDREGSTMNGRRVSVAGLVLVRQRPGSASGVIFMTIEDETDIANAVVWPKIFERFRPVVLGARLVKVSGKVQSESGVIHVVADRLDDLTPLLSALSEDGGEVEALARADEVRRPGVDPREKNNQLARLLRLAREEPGVVKDLQNIAERAVAVMPKGRNFH